jgi:hypothetical protein
MLGWNLLTQVTQEVGGSGRTPGLLIRVSHESLSVRLFAVDLSNATE